ncbi:MAG: hypothetical protein LBO69_01260, partial [Ignavibacteria bacterium]|nr:hypothetical protein [Ignavibacteria bacterium]
MKKILYLHGLDGSLSQDKRNILETHFEIVSPQLDYRNTPDCFHFLSKLIKSEQVDAVIGNSMGGCFAYYLSIHNSLPALCFNPALEGLTIDISLNLPPLKKDFASIIFVIGGRDDVVIAEKNFQWICQQNLNPNFILKWYNEMPHVVYMDVFA